jgi:hypothetical protein
MALKLIKALPIVARRTKLTISPWKGRVYEKNG